MTNLFEGENDDTITLEENKKYLEDLVGEGKKFKDLEALARGKLQSDNYIKQLERRSDQMREDYLKLHEEYKTVPKLQELLDQLSKKQQESSNDHQNVNDDQNKKPVIDPAEIESLVSQSVQKLRASEREQANFNLVKGKLTEHFGNNFQNKFKTEIENLGMTEEEVNNLARKHPQVLLKTFGLDAAPAKKENFSAPPRSEQRRDSFAPHGGHQRTWMYYEKMRQDNPKLYYDPKTLVQITKDAAELGDAFEDGPR